MFRQSSLQPHVEMGRKKREAIGLGNGTSTTKDLMRKIVIRRDFQIT